MQKNLSESKLINVVSFAPVQPLIFSEDEPLVILGFLLGVARKNNLLVKNAEGELTGEASSADLFQAFYPDFRNVWKKLYTIRLKDVARKIRFLDAGFPLGMYYYTLKNSGTRFADAVVTVKGTPVSFITPYNILYFMYRNGTLESLRADAIQSSVITAGEDVRVYEVVRLMLEKWIRKLLIGNRVLDDRNLVAHALFNMNNLSLLAKDPEAILNAPISSFDGLLKEPETYSKKRIRKMIAFMK